jgi:hypothetical protein
MYSLLCFKQLYLLVKKRKARVSKKLTIKRGISPSINDTIKTEEVKLDYLPSECDIIDIPIKQEGKNFTSLYSQSTKY